MKCRLKNFNSLIATLFHSSFVWKTYFTAKIFIPSRHERSQSDLYWERHLRELLETSQKRWLFCDIFKTSQIHLKKCVFFCDVCKTSQKHLKKDVFCVTSLRRLKHISKKMSFPWLLKNISRKYFWCFKNTSQKWFRVISVGLLEYLIK